MNRFPYVASALLFSLSASAKLPPTSAVNQLLETRVCNQCDLSNSDLSGLDLSGVDLSRANLSGASLVDTNLRGANLQDAIMIDVILSGTLLAGANLMGANLSSLDIDRVFEYIEITGTKLEGARFKFDVVCGPPPKRGGWGCQHISD